MYSATLGARRYTFADLATLMAKATPLRSGDQLAGIAAATSEERVAAQVALADVPLTTFLREHVIPYETDEVTRLIVDTHDRAAFAPVAHLTVGGFRDWLLSDEVTTPVLSALAPGVTPEMAAAVSKIMRTQDLMLVAAKCSVVTALPQHRRPAGTALGAAAAEPSDRRRARHRGEHSRRAVARRGDAVIGINPATDSPERAQHLLTMLDDIRIRLRRSRRNPACWRMSRQRCDLIRRDAPVDLVFQSIAGTEAANRSFGIDLALLREAREAALALQRGTVGDNVMYFETGQGSALSADAHHGVDQQTLEARAYAVARAFKPLLVNTVRRLHRPGISVRRQADHPRRTGGSFLRQADGRADGRRRLLHQSRRS